MQTIVVIICGLLLTEKIAIPVLGMAIRTSPKKIILVSKEPRPCVPFKIPESPHLEPRLPFLKRQRQKKSTLKGNVQKDEAITVPEKSPSSGDPFVARKGGAKGVFFVEKRKPEACEANEHLASLWRMVAVGKSPKRAAEENLCVFPRNALFCIRHKGPYALRDTCPLDFFDHSRNPHIALIVM